MMDFNEACSFVGIGVCSRQRGKWDRRFGLAYRAAKHFESIHQHLRELNAEITVENMERATKDLEELPLHEVPVPDYKIRVWLNETSHQKMAV